MLLYNTLTRKKEEFIPYDGKRVGFYTCGPTVYHYAHIGNMRNYIGHDILDKTLRYLGYDVTRVMNITDVGHLKSDSDSGEDKMVASAKREHKSVMDIAKFYTDAFFHDFDALNLRRPDIVSPATDNIDEYIKIISKLLEDGYAYQGGGNVYFDVSKVDDYYKLTNHKEDEMVVGVRDGVEYDNNKRNQADFALWFTKSKFDDQDLKWDSPFCVGYPGWNIECSGISIKYLGEHLDIHGGGVDNIFPHHTNEIAQSEAYLGHKWCNYWFHNEHLMDDSGKMSKSKGAILSVSRLIEEGYNPLAVKLMCLMSNYRKQLVFSYDIGELDTTKFGYYTDKFKEELSNDLNTANGITLIYDLLKDDSVNGHTKIEIINDFDKVFSLDLTKKTLNTSIDMDKYIKDKIEERRIAKMNKNYELSDSIRDELLDKGIILTDTREGAPYKMEAMNEVIELVNKYE